MKFNAELNPKSTRKFLVLPAAAHHISGWCLLLGVY
jgi:hypothetical protein